MRSRRAVRVRIGRTRGCRRPPGALGVGQAQVGADGDQLRGQGTADQGPADDGRWVRRVQIGEAAGEALEAVGSGEGASRASHRVRCSPDSRTKWPSWCPTARRGRPSPSAGCQLSVFGAEQPSHPLHVHRHNIASCSWWSMSRCRYLRSGVQNPRRRTVGSYLRTSAAGAFVQPVSCPVRPAGPSAHVEYRTFATAE